MKKNSLTLLFCWFSFWLPAQLPPSCNGTVSAIACDITCISCNFNGFSGTTEGYPSGVAPDFCGTVENVQWLGFIAGADEATFTITPSGCLNGDGVQVALYTDCNLPPIACDKGEMDGGNLPVHITTSLLPGASYFLLVDGYAGDQCAFTVSVSPVEAVFQPPLGVVTTLSGPSALCPFSSAQYQTQPVAGAAAYIWSGPAGTLFNGQPGPATILGSEGLSVTATIGDIGGNICVQAANACEVNPPCSASIPVSVLDDSARPEIAADTVASLYCNGAPLTLPVQLPQPANIAVQWTVDSIAGGRLIGNTGVLLIQTDSVGIYHLTATHTATGCTSTASIRVTPPVLPQSPEITIAPVSCYGNSDGSIIIGDIAGGVPPFTYSVNDDLGRLTPAFHQLAAGDYHLSIEDAGACRWDTLLTIAQPEDLLVVLEADTSVLLGQSLILWDSTMVNYPDRVTDWELTVPDMGDTTRCAACPVTPIHSFRYVLQVTDSNGCRATDSRSVLVRALHQVYIPNVFQPTSDTDANHRLGIYCGDDVKEIKQFDIFNVWGNAVHSRSHLAPDDGQLWWDGRFRGKNAPPGVYIYYATIVFKDGSERLFRGDVTLLR